MKKELQGLEEGPETDIRGNSLRKYEIWKHQVMMTCMNSEFKKITSIYDRVSLQLSKCSENASIPKWMIDWFIGLGGRVFTNGLGDLGSIPGRVINGT